MAVTPDSFPGERQEERSITITADDQVQQATLVRGSGNFAISVIGTDARALYKNCLIERTQLGGTSTSEMSQVTNGVDGTCFTVYADKTAEFHGDVTWQAGDILRATATQDIGTSSAPWDNIHGETVHARTPLTLGHTQMTRTGVTSISTTLNLTGGFGWTAKVTNLIGPESQAKFVGNSGTQAMAARSYYGTGAGLTWCDVVHNGTDGYVRTGAGLLRLDPAGDAVVFPSVIGDPGSPVDGSIWYDSDNDRYRGRKNGANFTFADEADITGMSDFAEQSYYVGKHGNDSNSGLNPEDAFLTISAAITAAAGQSPSSSNRFVIVVEDAGIYTENVFMGTEWVSLFAPNASVVGQLTLNDNVSVKLKEITNTSGIIINKTGGNETSWVEVDKIVCPGISIGALNTGTDSVLNIEAREVYVENGIGFGDISGSMGHMHVVAEDIYISGTTGNRSALVCATNGHLLARVNHIVQTSAGGSNCKALWCIAGESDVIIGKIECDIAYDVAAAATLDMLVADLLGTETVVAGGVARVTRAGGKFPPSATDPTSPTALDGDTYHNTALDMLMTYDAGRAKWLSVATETLQFGYFGNLAAGAYFRMAGYVQCTAARGYPAHFDGTVVGISYSRDDVDAATLEVTGGGTAISTLASSATSGQDETLNDDFTAGTILGARNQAGGNIITNPVMWVRFRWRA